MTTPLSLDLRKRIADAIVSAEENHPLIAERFGVSVTTVERISRKQREGRSLEARKQPGRACALETVHLDRIRAEITRDPYMSSYEVTERFNKRFPNNRVHRSTVLRAMHQLGYSFKKTPYAPQRDRPDIVAERHAFRESQHELHSSRLVFIDESGCHPGIGPLRGWAPQGEPLSGPEQTYARGQHVSMIAALNADGISALMTVDGGVKIKDFRRFVEQRLAPTLRPGDIVCWDNINMHKNAGVFAAVENAGASSLRLPRYSPDLNPIEATWSKVKALVRHAMPKNVRDLKAAIRRTLHRVRDSDALGWIQYCGFSLPYL
ncbi:MAG: IS630 family transposase [Polyangiaceae bacterium]|nr:IS630 family transposase [Polyangiaceae bacterium]